jgi:hypothetical protein
MSPEPAVCFAWWPPPQLFAQLPAWAVAQAESRTPTSEVLRIFDFMDGCSFGFFQENALGYENYCLGSVDIVKLLSTFFQIPLHDVYH